MQDFIIAALIMLGVSMADFHMRVKTMKKRMMVFYVTVISLSLALAALHCIGFRLDVFEFR